MKATKDEIRFELEVGGAKGFLAPLTFAVVEAALGFTFKQKPQYLTAGAIVINSLWVRGSKTLQKGGANFDEACSQAYFGCIHNLQYVFKDDEITVNFKGKDYSCKIGEVKRETLEEVLGLILPFGGTNPKPLTAGKMIIDESWISGDEEIKENPELLIPACLAAYHLIKFRNASIKKV